MFWPVQSFFNWIFAMQLISIRHFAICSFLQLTNYLLSLKDTLNTFWGLRITFFSICFIIYSTLIVDHVNPFLYRKAMELDSQIFEEWHLSNTECCPSVLLLLSPLFLAFLRILIWSSSNGLCAVLLICYDRTTLLGCLVKIPLKLIFPCPQECWAAPASADDVPCHKLHGGQRLNSISTLQLWRDQTLGKLQLLVIPWGKHLPQFTRMEATGHMELPRTLVNFVEAEGSIFPWLEKPRRNCYHIT